VGSNWKSLAFDDKKDVSGPIALSVRHLSTATKIKDVSFDLRAGEVLGIAGLLASGRTELLRAIFGLDPISAGQVLVNGQEVRNLTPRKMKALGLGFTAEDRKKEGLILDFSVLSNMTLAPMDRVSKFGWLLPEKAKQLALDMVDKLDVKTAGLTLPAGSLSGGNQQKIVIGNWLNTQPTILLMDEPSRGVDVQAKEQIFRLIRKLADQGLAVLFVSSELEEVQDVCDRILVLHEGRISGTFDHKDVSLELLMAKAMQPLEMATQGNEK
jgi:ribose transport system ATP-binding protein